MTRKLHGAALLVVAGFTGAADARQNRLPQLTGNAQIEIVPLRDNIYVLGGGGANIVVSVGRDGVLMVDASRAASRSSRRSGSCRSSST